MDGSIESCFQMCWAQARRLARWGYLVGVVFRVARVWGVAGGAGRQKEEGATSPQSSPPSDGGEEETARALGIREVVSFRNDVMAVISKAGCNAGACHGNAN